MIYIFVIFSKDPQHGMLTFTCFLYVFYSVFGETDYECDKLVSQHGMPNFVCVSYVFYSVFEKLIISGMKMTILD